MTRKALKGLVAGDRLELISTDPLAIVDIPAMINETGDRIDATERTADSAIFLIEKCNR